MNDRNLPKRPRYRDEDMEPPRGKGGLPFPVWTLVVIVLSVCLLAGAWVIADGHLTRYAQFNAMRAAISGDVFHGPVSIDDVTLTGLTRDQARARLEEHTEATTRNFEITLASGEDSWHISTAEIPMEWNTEALLEKAYQVGRTGTLEERYQQVQGLAEPVQLYSEFVYDKKAVRQITDAAAATLSVAPMDAAVVAFDVANRTFAFADDVPGQTVDADRLYETVIDRLDSGRYGETIQIETTPLTPNVTRAELESNYTRIASYTTKTTDDSNRNTNISLAASAFNGKMIPPGGELSFNETTGKRTREGGYMEAGAIENGRTIKEIGGGICQVSSTLFNAMVRANCEIVKRKPHAWPSDYVPRGEDATVDWPNLDLVMKNASDAPIFLTAWYEDRTVTVEVYGLSEGAGISYELESITTYERKPTEVVYTYNGDLPIGTTQELRKPRTGYVVETYKITLQDGQEVSREKLYTSEYRMINEEYEYNDGNPPPVVEGT